MSSIIAAKSSGFAREFSASDGGASMMCTDNACGPRRESAIENSSFVPVFTVAVHSGRDEASI